MHLEKLLIQHTGIAVDFYFYPHWPTSRVLPSTVQKELNFVSKSRLQHGQVMVRGTLQWCTLGINVSTSAATKLAYGH